MGRGADQRIYRLYGRPVLVDLGTAARGYRRRQSRQRRNAFARGDAVNRRLLDVMHGRTRNGRVLVGVRRRPRPVAPHDRCEDSPATQLRIGEVDPHARIGRIDTEKLAFRAVGERKRLAARMDGADHGPGRDVAHERHGMAVPRDRGLELPRGVEGVARPLRRHVGVPAVGRPLEDGAVRPALAAAEPHLAEVADHVRGALLARDVHVRLAVPLLDPRPVGVRPPVAQRGRHRGHAAVGAAEDKVDPRTRHAHVGRRVEHRAVDDAHRVACRRRWRRIGRRQRGRRRRVGVRRGRGRIGRRRDKKDQCGQQRERQKLAERPPHCATTFPL